MRAARFLSALIAFALLGLVPFVSSPATALVPGADKAAPARATTDVHVGARIRKKGSELYMVGNVTPPQGPVIIQKATKCNKATGECNFKMYKKLPVRKGRYQTKVEAPDKGTWYWQARVGPHKSAIWVACKTTSSSCG